MLDLELTERKDLHTELLQPSFFTIRSVSYEEALQQRFPNKTPNKQHPMLFMQTVLKHSTGIVNWKDPDLRFLGCNKNVANLLGLKSSKDIVGKSDNDLVWGTDGYAKIFEQEDREVLSGTMKFILGRYQFAGKKRTMLVKKLPIVEGKNITGIINYLTEIPDFNLMSVTTHLAQAGVKITPQIISNVKATILRDKFGELLLTEREEECLHYLLKGLSAKEIARILGLSYRTVEAYLENIKNKFKCRNKTALIVKAMEKGYLHYQPTSVVLEQFNASESSG